MEVYGDNIKSISHDDHKCSHNKPFSNNVRQPQLKRLNGWIRGNTGTDLNSQE